MQQKVEAVLGNVLVWALLTVTLLVTPMFSMDPINPIKMLAVTVVGFMGLGILISNHKVLKSIPFKTPLILITCFTVWQIIVFIVSEGGKLQQLFGTTGRNTGLITYIALSILFVVAMAATSAAFLNRFIYVVLAVGSVSIIYGTVQAVGADPFNWSNPYAPVFGFLGNPNFLSSLLGILGSFVFSQLFSKKFRIQVKVLFINYLLATLFVIYKTASQQGFLVLTMGIGIVFGIYLLEKSRLLGITYAAMSTLGFFLVFFGTLNKGPLASILYKNSVTYRGDYWRAGWKMTIDHPIFGIGLDSYGDWYRRSRTLEATLRRGPDVTSNAAHNVYLDMSSNGGFPLLVIYIALMTLVIISAFKVIKRESTFNPTFVGLFSAWVAFQAQSIISINQIGLAIWGWVLSGLIIGYEVKTRNTIFSESNSQKTKILFSTQKLSAVSILVFFVSTALGVIVGTPPYSASTKFKSALDSGNAQTIEGSAYIWPLADARMVQVASILDENGFSQQALKVAVDSTRYFPNSYIAWNALYYMKGASSAEKDDALIQMKRLDPLNPNLK